jgi:hypothetical protein
VVGFSKNYFVAEKLTKNHLIFGRFLDYMNFRANFAIFLKSDNGGETALEQA